MDVMHEAMMAGITHQGPQSPLPALDGQVHRFRPKTEPSEPLARLQIEIRSRLERGEMPDFKSIVQQLGISCRTLQRRLHDAETNFLLELDRARNELAGIYLDDPNRTLAEIAALLGYADQSAFQRAFRRWRSTTPKRYRIARRSSST